MGGLDNGNEARKLFSLHAFEKEEPLDGYAEVFEKVMQYAQGLPLALTVLGSSLKDQTVLQWEGALDQYKQIPDEKIQSVLQVSYDGLTVNEKNMFLDIACFFKGELSADVMKIFESCNFYPKVGISRLIDKCLITVGFHIGMHDLLQDMGREIVQKESKEPGARSRLWSYEDICHVLVENTELVIFKMYEGRIKEIISGQFKNLTKMKFSNCKFLTEILDLSSCSNLEELVIAWCENLVEVHDSVGLLDKLVGLQLYGCPNVKRFPRRLKLRSLRYLKLLDCSKLEDFSQIKCKMELLRSIDLCGTQIKEWASSNIGYLTPTLRSLSLEPSIHLSQNQKEFCLSDYPIRLIAKVEWNSHFKRCFTGIEHLLLTGGGINLAHLLIGIPHMRDLKSLSLQNPTNLAIDEIYSSIGYFTGLEKLQLRARPIFNNSYLDGFSFYCSSTLQELDLSRSVIVELPPSMKSFVKLRILTLFSCNKLQEILHLPPNIQELDAHDCFSLERCPEVSTKFTFYTCDLRELRWIDLNRCKKLDANIGSQVPDPSFVEEHI
ncbi:disease resistance protein RUN1-like [Juglans regia]|uniref:Disease resistance protein RUN1-like n=1 Tax=Juglans regia TaxID=51240 RepID=A0A6P9EGJ1_JUGRE|nr:disease resistance protein RUN1-like [Juglans regia]